MTVMVVSMGHIVNAMSYFDSTFLGKTPIEFSNGCLVGNAIGR
jgi:hypothetical protein